MLRYADTSVNMIIMISPSRDLSAHLPRSSSYLRDYTSDKRRFNPAPLDSCSKIPG